MPNPVINRNNTSLTLAKEVFGKKSKEHVGKEFFAPQIGDSLPVLVKDVDVNGTKQDVLTNINSLLWIGIEDMVGILDTSMRRIAAEIYLDNLDEKTGQFNQAQWELDIADFSAGFDRLSDIETQLDNLAAEQVKIVDDENFGAEDANGVKTEAAAALEKELHNINSKVKPLRIKKATITAKYAARAAVRVARKEKEKLAQGSAPVAQAA